MYSGQSIASLLRSKGKRVSTSFLSRYAEPLTARHHYTMQPIKYVHIL